MLESSDDGIEFLGSKNQIFNLDLESVDDNKDSLLNLS